MNKNIVFFLLIFKINSVHSNIKIDYATANKNTQQYDQVPRGDLIWMKYAAIEPAHFSDGLLRGHGWLEPLENEMIIKFRQQKDPIYVDYFTTAKETFYRDTQGYEVCGSFTRTLKLYKELQFTAKKNNYKYKNKFEYLSIPHHIYPPIGVIGIGSKKRHLFSKHIYPNTNVYNIKSILDDPELYTTQITGAASSIKEYIYLDSHTNMTIKPIYKKRIYDFVASNAIQITLMLKAGRMDYADMIFTGDFYAKQLKISDDVISFKGLSNVHPELLTNDNVVLEFIVCNGHNLEKLKQRVAIINKVAKDLRGDKDFWSAVLKQFTKDVNHPNIDPQDYYFTKEAILRKADLDQGIFDG